MKGMTELLKGVLEGVVLQVIQNSGETYGYEITNTLVDLGFQDIVEGTVYTILLRLEKKKLVTVEKRKSELGPARKFYRLNADGEKCLQDFWKKWVFLSDQLAKIKK
ncbi:PadR family transcriptional regulator [Enterococcus diestrammenae]|uniref:PadR family transcriptional regulator, regulatory protein PadR n=1 Tax=Enterococcus diestrammenae TaxID=1155073 RepID=A0ABV0EYR7_9ENTE|nr:PadR family transcriptional regulator [Enterococcus diestrammenae]KAF1294759.1 PadR family transcriptional regulator [Enterococcus diestrammenae]